MFLFGSVLSRGGVNNRGVPGQAIQVRPGRAEPAQSGKSQPGSTRPVSAEAWRTYGGVSTRQPKPYSSVLSKCKMIWGLDASSNFADVIRCQETQVGVTT